MASYNYTTVITLVDESTINFAIPSVTPSVTNIVPVDSQFENMITGVIENMGGNFMTSPLPNDYDLTSTVAGMGSVFGDSVYQYDGSFEAGLDTYTSQEFLLVTTAIDAGIALLPQTTLQEEAIYNYAVAQRAAIDTAFNAASYTTANNLIELLTNLIEDGTEEGATFTFVLSLTGGGVTINSLIADTLAPFLDTGNEPVLYAGGYLNFLTNTLTDVVYEYTWNFTLESAVSQNHNITQSSVYPDGVYTNYSSVITSWNDGGDYPATLNSGTSYLLVTTTIDNQITLFEDNYDPDNTAEAIALSELQTLQTEIAAAFADEDYTLTNELIVQAQAILANGLSREISAALTSDADMSVFFTVPPAMPTGTYTEGSGTITNTLTGVAFTFDGFPTDSADLTQALNSEDLGFGADFPDGVYQIVVTWLVDGLLFTAECYLAVTTDWQCCIDKAAGKKCGKLNTSLMQANLTNAVRIVAIYSDVDTANALISEGNRECSSCGCGCS